MRRALISLDVTVRAFRDLTAAPADGAATRARVLARAGQGAARRAALRRTSLFVGVALIALSSASAAWTAAGGRWRAPDPVIVQTPAASVSSPRAAGGPVRVIPSVSVEPAAASAAIDAESRAYGRAHRAHFVDDAPARALAAWSDYLAAYPRGTFAPEARYNRALCLIRLGRLAEAKRALRPFAEDRAEGYRRQEAGLLLDWLQKLDGAGAGAQRKTTIPAVGW